MSFPFGVIVILILTFLSGRSEADTLQYVNPGLADSTAEAITSSVENRCNLYPRCLLFQCCKPALQSHAIEYFASQREHASERLYSCMFSETSKCNYHMPMVDRMKGHPLLDTVITQDILYAQLAALPPTAPDVYDRLRHRKQFKVLYLAQGSIGRSKCSDFLKAMSDLMYLTFKEESREDGDFYFPKSIFAHGRLALNLAGRILEQRQGWVYDYFVFMDNDATPNKDPVVFLNIFEWNLFSWRPAIGHVDFLDGLVDIPEKLIGKGSSSVRTVYWQDMQLISYHRESLEILHSWIINYDASCIWASQVIQVLEQSLLYKNHILSFDELHTINPEHVDYPKDCFAPNDGMFTQLWKNHFNAIEI